MFGANKLKHGTWSGYMDPVSGAIAGSALIGYMGQQDAIGAAKGAAGDQLRQQQQFYEQQDPFSAGGHRAQYADQLDALMKGGPSSMMNDPMFKWMQQQGTDAVQRQHSAEGTLQSTAETRDLSSAAMGQANSYYQQQVDRLSTLSGATRGFSHAPTSGIDPSGAYNMSMGTTASTAGLFQAGMGIAGIYGHGGGGGGTSYNSNGVPAVMY